MAFQLFSITLRGDEAAPHPSHPSLSDKEVLLSKPMAEVFFAKGGTGISQIPPVFEADNIRSPDMRGKTWHTIMRRCWNARCS